MANEELTGLVVKIRADLSDYVLKLSQMEQQSNKTTKTVSDRFDKLGSVFAKIGVGVTAFAATAIQSASAWGNAVDDLADKTGMSGEEASKLLSMAKATGVTVEEANGIFGKFSKTIYSAADAYSKAATSGKESSDVLTNLGVSALNVDGSMKSTLDVFMDVKNSLNGMEDGWQKTAYEMQLFGKSGYEMHDMLNMTDDEIKKVIDKAQALGLIISSETAAGWEKFERQLKSTKGLMTSVGIAVGNEMLPELDNLLGRAQGLVKAFVGLNEQEKQNVRIAVEIAAKIGVVSTAIRTLQGAMSTFGLGVINPWIGLAAATWTAYDALKKYNEEKSKVTGYGGGGEIFIEKTRDLKGGTNLRYYKKDSSTLSGYKTLSDDEKAAYQANQQSAANLKGDTSYLEAMNDPGKLVALREKMERQKLEGGSTDSFLGGGGSDTQSAYEKYKQDTSDLIAMWGQQVQLETLSRSQFAENVQERLTGLSQVAVATKEVTDRDSLQANLQLKVNEINQESHTKAIERAEQNLALGKINEQQYIAIIEQQLKLATGTEEQMALEVKLKQIKSEAAQKDLEAQNQIENTRQQSEARLNAFYQSVGQAQAQQMVGLIEAEEGSSSIIEGQLAIKRQTVEKIRQAWEQEAALFNKYASGEIKVSEVAYEQQYAKTEALRVAYKSAVDGMAVEAVTAAKQTSDAWANNLAGIISNTTTAHDILKQQWSAFVAEVLKQQLKISASSNVFNSLLGGVFGLNKTKSASVTNVPTAGKNWINTPSGNYNFLASGANGWDVPNIPGDIPMYVHRREMVLPAELADKVRNSTGGGDVKVNVINNSGTAVNPNVSKSMDSGQMVVNIVLDAVTRNVNGLRDVVASAGAGRR